MPRTRLSLIHRVRRSEDPAAWREFVATYHPFLMQVAVRSGVPAGEAVDVVQDVFVSLVRRMSQFGYQPWRGRFRAWLARLTHNRSMDWHRRRNVRRRRDRRFAVGREPVCPREPPESTDAGMARQQSALQSGLARLRETSHPRSWQCFEQHVLGSRPAAEVAAELHLSTSAVYVNSSRLLERLRTLCRQAIAGEPSAGDGTVSHRG